MKKFFLTASIVLFFQHFSHSQALLINEILFNPYPDGVDFVEIYNASDVAVNLKGMSITNRKTDGSFNTLRKLATADLYLEPASYLAFTTDDTLLCEFYDCLCEPCLLVLPKMPSLPNTEGCLVLLSSEGEVVDEFCYHEKMHHQIIADEDGVSLERVDPLRPASDTTNWMSGSFQTNYATPGFENAHYVNGEELKSGEKIWVSPESFTPNNDGEDDLVHFFHRLDGEYIANAVVYDMYGEQHKQLYNQDLLSPEGVISWDGVGQNGQICPIGIYVLFFEAFTLEKKLYREKILFVLSAKR